MSVRFMLAALATTVVGCASPAERPAEAAAPGVAGPGSRSSVWDLQCRTGSDRSEAVASFVLQCPDGEEYVLEAPEGRRCETRQSNGSVTAAICVVEDSPGRLRVSAKAECATGCICTTGAGSCTRSDEN